MLLRIMELSLSTVMSIILVKKSSEVFEKFRLRNFQGSHVIMYLLSTFLLNTHHYHMILSKQKCCLLLNGVSIESKTYLCTSDKAVFSNKKYESYTYWAFTEFYDVLTFLGDFYGHKLCSTYFYITKRAILCQTSKSANGLTSYSSLTIPLGITMNLRNLFRIYI